jgi:N,N'-diacetyllegionaminate synthase
VIEIDGKKINARTRPYTICEAGINHGGNFNKAIKMIHIAKASGADAIKFQTFKASQFCNKDSELYKEFKRCEFSFNQWKEIKEMCDYVRITFLSTPQNYTDLELLLKLDMKAIKIGSDDLTNIPLIRSYATTKLPILLSCGMSYEQEIENAVDIIRGIDRSYPLVIMHCTSQYPTDPEDVNISKLRRLSMKYPTLVLGYSDHTIGNTASILAVGKGAKVFETHFTLSNKLKGPDHKFSKNISALNSWIRSIHEAYEMLGHSELKPTVKELTMRLVSRRSVTAIKSIKKGQMLTDKNIGMMRPTGDGLAPHLFSSLLGLTATRNISIGEKLQRDDIDYGAYTNKGNNKRSVTAKG